jgi:hypothetical protein
MLPGDRGYVFKSWLGECRYRPKSMRADVITRYLDTSRTIVLANGPTVHAFACGDGETLHFAYVPFHLRGNGLGRRVVTALMGRYPDQIIVTHVWPYESTRYIHARKAA